MLDLKKLKVDPKLFHHYIIGVAIHSMRSSHAGEMFLKYGPIYFTNDDVERVQDAALLSVDKVFKTSLKEAASIHDCNDLIMSLTALKLSASANDSSLHHFSCEFEIPDSWNWFDGYVANANKCSSVKGQLADAKI